MITIVSGTNRPGSKTSKVAEYIYQYISDRRENVKLLDLCDIGDVLVHTDMYSPDKMHEKVIEIQDGMWIPAQKLIIVSPEYNGSFSGILKTFIDAISIRNYGQSFADKKVALVGVASGRAGNLRGMEHLTGLLNYLKMHVYPTKLPISQIDKHLDDNGQLSDDTKKPLHDLLDRFLIF